MTSSNAHPMLRPWNISAEDEQVFRVGDVTFKWLCQQSGEFFRPYAGKWIAAKDSQIIASADTMNKLLEQLGDVDLRTVILHRVERPGWRIYQC